MRWKKTSKHTCSMLTAHISHIQVYLYEMNGKCSDFSVDVDNFKERKMLMMSMELKLRNEISSMYIRIFIHWMHNLYETTKIDFCWRGFVHIFFFLIFVFCFRHLVAFPLSHHLKTAHLSFNVFSLVFGFYSTCIFCTVDLFVYFAVVFIHFISTILSIKHK